jgi:cytochrome c556
MKYLFVLATAAAALSAPVFAQEAESPFADVVEARHGLMLLMAQNLGTLGAMAKGEAAYDAATASKAAANIAALSSVISPDLFPAGSEYQAAPDSFALPAIWSDQAGFLARIADLNMAAGAMVASAGTSVDGVKEGMAAIGGACGACHKAYRQPEE